MAAFALALFYVLSGAAIGAAQETSTTPAVGYHKIWIKGERDTPISAPILRPSTYAGKLGAVESDKLRLVETTWQTGQFDATANGPAYYVEIATGDLQGLTLPILANTADTLTVETRGLDLTNIPGGILRTGTTADTVRVRQAWKVGDLFGEGANLLLEPAAAGADPFAPGDRVLVPDDQTIGRSKSYASVLAYIEGGAGWTDLAGGVPADGTTLLPGRALSVRKSSDQDQVLLLVGFVERGAAREWIPALTTDQAQWLASRMAEPQTLELSGLYQSGVFKGEVTPGQQEDRLLALNPKAGDFEPLPSEELYHAGGAGGWRRAGAAGIDAGATFSLQPVHPVLLQKRSGFTGGFWVQPAP